MIITKLSLGTGIEKIPCGDLNYDSLLNTLTDSDACLCLADAYFIGLFVRVVSMFFILKEGEDTNTNRGACSFVLDSFVPPRSSFFGFTLSEAS